MGRGRPVGGSLSLPEIQRDDVLYMAGLFDGEGSVMIVRQKTPSATYHRLLVSVTSTSFGVIDWLEATFGGKASSTGKPRPNCKPAKSWRIQDGRAGELLALLLPYLKIKHDQALLGILLRTTKGGGRISGDEERRDALYHRREDMRLLLRDFNHRGEKSTAIPVAA